MDDLDTIRAMLDDPKKGSWEGNVFTPKMSAMAELKDPMNLVNYFDEHGGENQLNLP